MDERKYIKEVIARPATRGEREQAERLRKFSADSGEIVEMRAKLRGLMDDLVDDEEKLKRQQGAIGGLHILPQYQRRAYDRSILVKSPSSAFVSLFSYFGIRREFRQKYKAAGTISWSFWSFFSGGDLFWPSMQVYRFVQKLVVIMEELREPFRRMYAQGWLSRAGADVLSPLEFNLIGEMERLTADASIFNVLLDIRKPRSAVKKINPFLGYYFSLTRNGVYGDRLVEALRKSQRRIVSSDGGDSRQTERAVAAVRQLLSGETDREFVVPLFECAYHRTLTGEDIRAMVRLEEVDDAEYRADAHLYEAMIARKRKFQERLREAIAALTRDIELVTDIGAALSRRYPVKHGALDIVEYLLYYLYHNNDETFRIKKNNLAGSAADACEVFAFAYEPLIAEGVYVRVEQDKRFISLFKPDVFERQIEAIKRESRVFLECVRKGYGWPLLKKETLSREEAIFMNALSTVTDAFYSMGLLLFDCLRDASLPESAAGPLGAAEIGVRAVPSADRVILAAQSPAPNRYTVSMKTVRDALREAKDFCFTFSARFEWAGRDFSQTVRQRSIAEMTGSLDALRERLQRMEAGDIDDIMA
ncbi:MAG TPA: hypothetical protein PKJ16_08140 [Spirochaetota bacterium]|nr:hypothetical protein [Spirochaetota bacterium]HPU87369.1 hypothetical protein [Spirochaetota bacterium]